MEIIGFKFIQEQKSKYDHILVTTCSCGEHTGWEEYFNTHSIYINEADIKFQQAAEILKALQAVIIPMIKKERNNKKKRDF